MDNLIGQQLSGRYVIESLLGKQRGRRTFLAKDVQTQQRVVIKLMLFGPDFTWQDLKLFEREAETLKSLDHPAIPKYLDSFELETGGWKGFALVQTYIEAKSLRQWVEAGRTYQEKDLRAIATQLLIILSYLHSRYPAVIHRDIKPSNILFQDGAGGEPDKIYLVDFGSVHTISQSGTLTVVGTYGYMPPEQFGGRAVPASDLYSLGMTLLSLIIGAHPADMSSADSLCELEYVALSAEFRHCIAGLIQTDLAQRTASASMALQHLTAFAPTLPQKRQCLVPPSIQAQSSTDVQTVSLRSSTLEVSKTFNEFEIQFSEDRLISAPLQEYQSTYIFLVTMMVLFVFGGLFFGSSLSFLWAAVLAAILLFSLIPLYWDIQKNNWDIQKNKRSVLALRLLLSDNDSILMRVDRLDPTHAAGRLSADVANLQRTALLSYVQLINIDVILPSQNQSAQVSFFFVKDAKKLPERLTILGTRAEFEWLHNQLAQWKNLPIEQRMTVRPRLGDRKLN